MTHLLCYMVLIQLPIDLDRMNAAKEFLKKMREQAESLKGYALKFDFNRRQYENCHDVLDILKLMEDHENEWEFADDDEDFAETFLGWATEERLNEILECINLVDPGQDMAWRELPDGSTILIAGGDSTGDEPDGYGYGCLKDASRFGLFEPLGIT